MRKTLLGLALALAASPLAAAPYDIDPSHTEIGFEAVHLSVTHVHGRFTGFSGTVDLDSKDLTKSKVTLSIDAATVQTGVDRRDNHLKSADFFDVTNTPKITFTSTKIVKTKDGYDLTGDLTIRGVTKPVTLQAQISDDTDMGPMMGVRRGFSLRGSINRFDYNVGWSMKTPGGTLIVGENIALNIDGELALHKDKK